jgi:hypothetical protein
MGKKMKADTIENRLNAFCVAYGIAEKHHGSLALLAEMAYVLGYEINFWLRDIAPQEKEQSK